MRSEKEMRALICYAGSAPEASIGSKPIGSELNVEIVIVEGRSQGFPNESRWALLAAGEQP